MPVMLLDHLRRVARVMLLQQLVDAAGMFERRIVCGISRQRGWGRWSAACGGLRGWSCGDRPEFIARAKRFAGQVAAFFIIPRGAVVSGAGFIEAGV